MQFLTINSNSQECLKIGQQTLGDVEESVYLGATVAKDGVDLMTGGNRSHEFTTDDQKANEIIGRFRRVM